MEPLGHRLIAEPGQPIQQIALALSQPQGHRPLHRVENYSDVILHQMR
jgi:hypothetical protein